ALAFPSRYSAYPPAVRRVIFATISTPHLRLPPRLSPTDPDIHSTHTECWGQDVPSRPTISGRTTAAGHASRALRDRRSSRRQGAPWLVAVSGGEGDELPPSAVEMQRFAGRDAGDLARREDAGAVGRHRPGLLAWIAQARGIAGVRDHPPSIL